MRVGIIGLGLIGGSMAKAYHRDARVTVYGSDRDPAIVQFACIAQAIHARLTDEILPTLDLLLLATYPDGVISELNRCAPMLKRDCAVIDLSGVKAHVCDACFAIAGRYGFTFVGGHPMAGTQYSGFKYSCEDLFDGAPMVIVPPTFDDIELLDRIRTLLVPARFGKISIITAQAHDRVIAFTSQLAHVVSNAYIKSPTARDHIGFSAGSYRDLTRVARLNPDMWTELFMLNRENLLFEIDGLIEALLRYRNALADGNASELRELLDEGRRIKEEVDGQ